MAAAAAPKFALYYFNGRGRAEVTRLLCAEAKIAYEDKRVEGKDWPALKAQAPFGQMPYVKVGNSTIAQSAAIERYVARIGKLYGANDEEAAQIDAVVEGVHDTVKNLMTAWYTKDEAEKKTKLDAYFKDEFPRWAGQLTALLKANAGGTGYFVGNNVSLADFVFFNAFSSVKDKNAAALTSYPELVALMDRVAARPNVAAWLKARPVTPF